MSAVDSPSDTDFRRRYGAWAVVAGASEGIGRAFCLALAARGIHLVLLARREAPLVSLADELEARFGIEALAHSVDLASPHAVAGVAEITKRRDVGLFVYNAAASNVGRFLDVDLDSRLLEIEVNCRTPLLFAHYFGSRFVRRARGGVVLMSSFSGMMGTPMVSSYAATKAFNTVLAEGLWEELRGQGVDVLAVVAGATRTPNFEATQPQDVGALARPMEPEQVVREALEALGRHPSRVTGRTQRAVHTLLRLLPRQSVVRMMGTTMRGMYGG